MRADWDLPDGVVDGAVIAAAVMAELHQERRFRQWTRKLDPARLHTTSVNQDLAVVVDADEAAGRTRLLRRARRGDVGAIAALGRRYNLTLSVSPAPRTTPRRARQARRRA